MGKNVVREKSIDFALRIVNLYKYLTEAKKEFVLSKHTLLSGTNIAKHVIVAAQAEDRSGFLGNMNIAMQRAVETEFWLLLLRHGEFLSHSEHESINNGCIELIKLLSVIVKTTKGDE